MTVFPIVPENYFGARYYASQLGRFLTPDWSDSPEPIPFANLQNPHSLNLCLPDASALLPQT